MLRCLSRMVLSFVFLLLVGCGFYLRDHGNIPDSLDTIYIQGVSSGSEFGRRLKLASISKSLNVVTNYQNYAVVLTILENNIKRRILSEDSETEVNEYEFSGIVKFTFVNGRGEVLVKSQQMEVIRDLRFDQNWALGYPKYGRILCKQIYQHMAEGILTYLLVLK